MTDIPDAAVTAAIEARYDHGTDPQPYHANRCRCGETFATAMEHLEHATRRELEAAFKHLGIAPEPRPYEHVLSPDELEG
jgi:phage terminase large subunit GpA-like protein